MVRRPVENERVHTRCSDSTRRNEATLAGCGHLHHRSITRQLLILLTYFAAHRMVLEGGLLPLAAYISSFLRHEENEEEEQLPLSYCREEEDLWSKKKHFITSAKNAI